MSFAKLKADRASREQQQDRRHRTGTATGAGAGAAVIGFSTPLPPHQVQAQVLQQPEPGQPPDAASATRLAAAAKLMREEVEARRRERREQEAADESGGGGALVGGGGDEDGLERPALERPLPPPPAMSVDESQSQSNAALVVGMDVDQGELTAPTPVTAVTDSSASRRIREASTGEVLEENHSLVVRHVDGKGRGVFWEPRDGKALTPGTGLLRLTPSLSVLSSSALPLRCSHCFSEPSSTEPSPAPSPSSSVSALPPLPTTLLRCAACKLVHYCGPKCQKRDWPRHKHECEALRRKGDPGDAVRALARVVWGRRTSTGRVVDGEGRVEMEAWRDMERMQSHRASLTATQKEPLGNLSMRLADFLGVLDGGQHGSSRSFADFGFDSAAEVLDMCSRFQTNTFTLSAPDLSPIGVAMSSTAALFNHSCLPNAVVVFPWLGARPGGSVAGQMAVIAIRDVQVGEEILTSYLDLSDPYPFRHKALQDRYFFVCDCTLCAASRAFLPSASALLRERPAATATAMAPSPSRPSAAGAPSSPSGVRTARLVASNEPAPNEPTPRGGDGTGSASLSRDVGGSRSVFMLGQDWIDPRETFRCPQGCGGWAKMPDLSIDATIPRSCARCGASFSTDVPALRRAVDGGVRALSDAEAAVAREEYERAYSILQPSLLALLPLLSPSSYPLLPLLRLAQTVLISLASASLPPPPPGTGAGAYFDPSLPPPGESITAEVRRAQKYAQELFDLAAQAGTLALQGMTASAAEHTRREAQAAVDGPVFPEGHPARGVQMATLAKLLLVEFDVSGASGDDSGRRAQRARDDDDDEKSSALSFPNAPSLPPVGSTERLRLAREMLREAKRELERGFGDQGGMVGVQAGRMLDEVEMEGKHRGIGWR